MTRRAALLFLVLAHIACAVRAAAADQNSGTMEPLVVVGASVDIDYAGDFNTPPNHLFRNRGTTPRVDEGDLNMAAAYIRKLPAEASRWGVEATAQAGHDSEAFGFSATAPNAKGAAWMRHLGPTNVSYLMPAGQGVTVQAGIFSSVIGYDSLYAKDNLNYTRPWGADFTPYLMLGVNAVYPLTRTVTVTGVLVNGYWHLAHANDVPSFGGQFAYKPTTSVTFKTTALYGPHQTDTAPEFWRLLSDTILERKTDRLTTAAELQIAREQVAGAQATRALWFAGQLPVRWAVASAWSVAVRPEFCWDSTGRWTGAEQSVVGVTSTLERRVSMRAVQTILRLEHRYDNSRGAAGGFFSDRGLVSGQHLLIGAAIVAVERSR